jgi:hypothetical protein
MVACCTNIGVPLCSGNRGRTEIVGKRFTNLHSLGASQDTAATIPNSSTNKY